MRGLDLFREKNGKSVPDFEQNGVYSTVHVYKILTNNFF